MPFEPHSWTPRCRPPSGIHKPVRVDPYGVAGPTRGQVRSRRWRRTSHGLYVPSHIDGTVPEQRVLEASMQLPPGGAVTGWAALRLMGGGFFDGVLPDGRTLRPVPLVAGPGQSRRGREGITWLEDRITFADLHVRRGIVCTRPERAVFDEARRAPDVREAVVTIDMAAAAEITSIARLSAYVDRHAGWTGVGIVRTALSLADELSRSPNESRTRLIWVLDAGLPKPLVNQPVWDLRGRLLGIADLLDPDAGLVGEYDGADHRRARRQAKDVAREERMRRVRLELVKITGPDLGVPRLVADRIRSTRGRAHFVAEPDRLWTVEAPPWWETEPDLDVVLSRRDLLWELHQQDQPQ